MSQLFGRSGKGYPAVAPFFLPWATAFILSVAGLATVKAQPLGSIWPGMAASAVSGLILTLIIFRLLGPFVQGLSPLWRIAILAAAIGSTAVLQSCADVIWKHMAGSALSSLVAGGTASKDLLATLLFYLLMNMAGTGLSFAQSLTEEVHRLDRSRLEAETGLLRLQLNPHFMVNALNAVSSLILSGQHPKAAAMTDKLSQFLRLSLQMSGTSFVTLGDELFATETYLDAEAIRFGDRLQVKIDCPEELEPFQVPNFILQPLAQAAVKFGLSASIGLTPVAIAAHRQGDQLLIHVKGGEGDVTRMNVPGQGVGLDAIRARLQLLYGEQAGLVIEMTEGYHAELRLPLNHIGDR